MTNQQDRRERIAAQVLAGIIASGRGYTLRVDAEGYTARVDVEHAVSTADALIAELDRTAPRPPSNHPEQPEGWVVWDPCPESRYPIRDFSGQWFHRVYPWDNRAAAQDVADELGCRVRKWPLDPAEDKPEVKPEGWVIVEDGYDYASYRDGIITVPVPFGTREEAEKALAASSLGRGYSVRRWPLDPAEDKEVQS